MKKTLLILTLIFLSKFSYCQDTLYLDNNSKVTVKTTAVYFEVVKPIDNGFKIQKYTIDNQLMYVETYKDKEHKVMNGPAIYYYNNRKIDKEGKCR